MLFRNQFFLNKSSSFWIHTKHATNAKVVTLDKNVEHELEANSFSFRRHPGTIKAKCIQLPDNIKKAIAIVLTDMPIKKIQSDGQALSRYLKCRHPPVENIQLRIDNIKQEIKDKLTDKGKSEKQIEQMITTKMYQTTYNWQPIDYIHYKSLTYLIGRSAPEYATIYRIFTEINQRVPGFKPKSYFDFGSGIGTGVWAASNFWKNSIIEYYLVDISRDMNDLSDLILRDGIENKESNIKNIFYRQFLPSSHETQYEVVLCAYSLFELPNQKTRLETLLKLWTLCERFLVIVDNGTLAGYKLIMEARNFILSLNNKDYKAKVFSPCPHEFECPRQVLNDKTPCNFNSSYIRLDLAGKSSSAEKELYSYIVLEKVHPDFKRDLTEKWPRLVRPTLVRTRHAVCRMCTHSGNLEEIIFTKAKHSKCLYKCARVSVWGDQLPISINENDTVLK